MNVLNIYVDESGNFGDVADHVRFCVVTFVLEPDEEGNAMPMRRYKDALYILGVDPDSMVFHTVPLIRQEEQFSAMSRTLRGKLFYQMLKLVRDCNLKFRSFDVDTAFVNSKEQMADALSRNIRMFMLQNDGIFADADVVKLYYDAGQKDVTRLLKTVDECCPRRLLHQQDARQSNCIMLQVADFLCSVSRLKIHLHNDLPFNASERRFFGSVRDFKRNVLRKVATKEI